MTVAELMENIIRMLSEDKIKITDEVEIDITQNNGIIGGNAHELLVRMNFYNETKLTIRS